MKRAVGFLLFLALASPSLAEETKPSPPQPAPKFLYEARVAVRVADLRRSPSDPWPMLDRDPAEESQLLYGEPVRVLEEKSVGSPPVEWARVEAPEQPEWSHHKRWEGYPGWVLKEKLARADKGWAPTLLVTLKVGRVRTEPKADSEVRITLSLGSRLKGLAGDKRWRQVRLLDGSKGWIAQEEVSELPVRFPNYPVLRENLVRTARFFLGDPYYWGGRSAHLPDASGPPHTAVDCSGLTGLVYLASGVAIPRDAQEQKMRAHPVKRDQLKAGDLVFLLLDENEPDKATHVMLYTGQGTVIEGPGTGQAVREIPLEERLKGIPYRRVAYGSYLP